MLNSFDQMRAVVHPNMGRRFLAGFKPLPTDKMAADGFGHISTAFGLRCSPAIAASDFTGRHHLCTRHPTWRVVSRGSASNQQPPIQTALQGSDKQFKSL